MSKSVKPTKSAGKTFSETGKAEKPSSKSKKELEEDDDDELEDDEMKLRAADGSEMTMKPE